MAISATFAADFSKFSTAVEQAETKLTAFRTESFRVESQLRRMGDSFSGRKILSDATLAVKAVQDLGGVTKLTEGEQKRLNATVTEAIAKYKALGQQAPPELLAIEKQTRAATSATDKMAAGMARMGEMGKKAFAEAQASDKMIAGMSAVGKTVEATTDKTGFLTTKMVAVGSAIGTAFGGLATGAIQAVGSALLQAAKDGQKFSQLAPAFERLTASLGTTSTAMLDMSRTAAKGLISDLDLMQATNKAVLLGLPITTAEMANLTRTASSLGRAMGQDATKSLDDLITALGRSSPMILDNLGLTVKVSEANDAYAATLGKTAGQLTETEKKMAFYRAAMEAARQKTETLGDQSLTATDQLSRLWTTISNGVTRIAAAANESGLFSTALGALATAAEQTTRVLGDYFEARERLLRQGTRFPTPGQLVDTMTALDTERTLAQIPRPKIFDQPAAPLIVAGPTQAEIKKITDSTDTLIQKQKDAAEASKRWHESYRPLQASFSTWSTQLDAHGAQMRTTISFYQAMPAAIHSMNVSFQQLIPTVQASTDRLMAMAKAVPQIGIPAKQMADDIVMGLATMGQRGLLEVGQNLVTSQNITGAKQAGVTLGTTMAGGMKSAFDKLGPTLMSAFTGGGNVAQSVGGLFGGELAGSLTKSLTGGLMKEGAGALSKSLGGMLGSVLPGLGTMLGALGGQLFGKLFGKSEHSKVNDMRDAAFAAAGGFDKLNEKAHLAGFTLERVLRAKTVKDYEAAIAELEAKLGSFADEQAADQARLNDAIQRYGFSLAELGPQLQSSRLNEQAKELIEDWRVLAAAGIDVSTINAKMAESMNAYLQQALKVGAEVPNAMRPILEAMAAQGTLVDENGNAITDLEASGVKFSETMTEGFDRVVKKLDELIVKLQGAGSAIGNIPRTIDVGVNYIAGSVPALNAAELPGYAFGTQGRFLDFKQGSAVMLHGKEKVTTEAEGRADAAALSSLADAIANLDRRVAQSVSRAVADALILAT